MNNQERIQRIKSGHPFGLWDIAVYVLIVAITVALIIAVSNEAEGAIVRVYYYTDSGEQTYEDFDLNEDRVFAVPTSGTQLTVIIEGGYVYVGHSDCADKTCEHMGKINRANRQIVCVPNRVVIEVRGKALSDGVVG